MFKLKKKFKEELIPKNGTYFMLGGDLMKIVNANEHTFEVVFYREANNEVVKPVSNYRNSVWREDIVKGNSTIIDPENSNIEIPEKLKNYV